MTSLLHWPLCLGLSQGQALCGRQEEGGGALCSRRTAEAQSTQGSENSGPPGHWVSATPGEEGAMDEPGSFLSEAPLPEGKPSLEQVQTNPGWALPRKGVWELMQHDRNLSHKLTKRGGRAARKSRKELAGQGGHAVHRFVISWEAGPETESQ